jgi:hypothetical protein
VSDGRIKPIHGKIKAAFPESEGLRVVYRSQDGALSHHFEIYRGVERLQTFVVYRTFLDDKTASQEMFERDRLRQYVPLIGGYTHLDHTGFSSTPSGQDKQKK